VKYKTIVGRPNQSSTEIRWRLQGSMMSRFTHQIELPVSHTAVHPLARRCHLDKQCKRSLSLVNGVNIVRRWRLVSQSGMRSLQSSSFVGLRLRLRTPGHSPP